MAIFLCKHHELMIPDLTILRKYHEKMNGKRSVLVLLFTPNYVVLLKYDDSFGLGLGLGFIIRTFMKGIRSLRHLCFATKRQIASLGQSQTRAKALKQRLCLSSFQRLSLIVALQGCLQEQIPFILNGIVTTPVANPS